MKPLILGPLALSRKQKRVGTSVMPFVRVFLAVLSAMLALQLAQFLVELEPFKVIGNPRATFTGDTLKFLASLTSARREIRACPSRIKLNIASCAFA